MKKSPESFEFPSFDSVKDYHIKKFSRGQLRAPAWRHLRRGLNLKGKCKNKDCQAYNQPAWSPLGFGQFHMSYQIYNTPCPICKRNLKNVFEVGLYKVKLTGTGQKERNGEETDNSDDESEEKTTFTYQTFEDDSYLNFGEKQSQLVHWLYLVLKADHHKNSRLSTQGVKNSRKNDTIIKNIKCGWEI